MLNVVGKSVGNRTFPPWLGRVKFGTALTGGQFQESIDQVDLLMQKNACTRLTGAAVRLSAEHGE